jgi:hypothetical protein
MKFQKNFLSLKYQTIAHKPRESRLELEAL